MVMVVQFCEYLKTNESYTLTLAKVSHRGSLDGKRGPGLSLGPLRLPIMLCNGQLTESCQKDLRGYLLGAFLG